MAWKRNRSPMDREGVERALRRSLKAAVSGDWLAAETWLERVVEADSEDFDAYQALARLYRRQGDVGRAIRMHQNLMLRSDLDKAQRIETLLELARDFEAGGYQERAVAAYEEVLDASPRNAEVLERLVELLHATREWPRALSLVRRLHRRQPEIARELEVAIRLAEARSKAGEGDHDGARQALKRCLRRDKHCGAAWALMGELEAERGRTPRAIDAWRRAIEAEPALGAELYPKIDAGYAARGKPQDFEKLLRTTLEARPGEHSARIALARALASRGDRSAAIEELARAIEVAPESAGLRVELGRQLLASGQEAEALKAYGNLLDALEREDLGAREEGAG